MIIPLAFLIFMLCACAIGWQAGDRRDRIVISIILAAAGLTAIAEYALTQTRALYLVGVIDIMLLCAVTHYAMLSKRLWPLWFAGLQAATVSTSICAVVFGDGYLWLFLMLHGFWSIPALLAMSIGLLKDRAAGVVQAA